MKDSQTTAATRRLYWTILVGVTVAILCLGLGCAVGYHTEFGTSLQGFGMGALVAFVVVLTIGT